MRWFVGLVVGLSIGAMLAWSPAPSVDGIVGAAVVGILCGVVGWLGMRAALAVFDPGWWLRGTKRPPDDARRP